MEITQIIAIMVIVVTIAIYLLISILKKGLRQTAIDLILLAEKTIGSGKGETKMKYAIEIFLTKLPIPIPASAVRWFIQATFDEIKEVLDYKPESEVK